MLSQRGLRDATVIIQKAAERLATGSKINRASDNPAGMIAVSKLDLRIKELDKKITLLGMEEARLGAKDGALSVVSGMLEELNGIVVSAANTAGLSQEEKQALQTQADSILQGMDFIANTTVFKGEKLFDSLFSTSLGKVDYKKEGKEGKEETASTTLAGLGSGGGLNLIDGDLEAAQKSVKSALNSILGSQGAIGNRIKNGIEPMRQVYLSEIEASQSVRSDIADTDIAAEMSNLVRGQILQQASIFGLLSAQNNSKQSLALLQNALG